MIRQLAGAALLGVSSLASAQCVPDSQAAAGAPVAIRHAAVIPMDRERVLADHTVIMQGGRITAIGPSATTPPPPGARCVDAQGKYLMPALADMHVHLLGYSWEAMFASPEARAAAKNLPYEDFLLPYLANGVTLVQVMSGTVEDKAVRDRSLRGEMLGPRMVLARMIDAPKKAWPQPLNKWVANATEAEAAVREAKEQGFDKMKVYSFLDKDEYDAIVKTAAELKMDVVGHIPNALSVEYVLDSNQKLIAHAEEIMKHANGDFSQAKIDYYVKLMTDKKAWITPTLVTTRSLIDLFADPQKALNPAEGVYFRHPVERDVWNFLANNLYLPIPAPAKEEIRKGFRDFQRPFTKALYDKGGRLLIGTDSPWPGLVPGFALHRELHELASLGIPNYRVLKMASVDAYEYLGEAAGAGTIEVGKRSDMILVDGNPLADLDAAAKVRGVMMQGRWIPGEVLAAKMAALAGH
ncbi:MAG: amidohydrolase family protein [Telluria sp.]